MVCLEKIIDVSIVIPVYNASKYLKQCLDSVLTQNTALSYEIICVDDGSTDKSSLILQEYKNKYSSIKVLFQNNAGAGRARNLGIEMARGRYILFLDSDDWLLPNAFSVLEANLYEEDLLCFNGKKYYEYNDCMDSSSDCIVPVESISGIDYLNLYLLENRKFPFVCVVLRAYKRDFLIRNTLFFEPHIFHEDNLFTPKVCYYAKNVKVISDVLYVYRIRESSKMTNVSNRKIRDCDVIFVANSLSDFFLNKVKCRMPVLDCFITHHYQVVAGRATIKEWLSLHRMIEWKYYKLVSRGKLRHRVGYFVNRYMPIFSKLFFSIRL